jgi:SAM-dependent methyltransferase
MKLRHGAGRYSLNDLGCGYGALRGYLDEFHPDSAIDYLGIDLAGAMIRRARRLWRRRADARFVVGDACPRTADYGIASGIFNVKLDEPTERWERLIEDTLAQLCDSVRHGFAVNLMAPLPPSRPAPPQLYRAPSDRWIGFCERELGMSVELVAGYGMPEYTLLARKRLS